MDNNLNIIPALENVNINIKLYKKEEIGIIDEMILRGMKNLENTGYIRNQWENIFLMTHHIEIRLVLVTFHVKQ